MNPTFKISFISLRFSFFKLSNQKHIFVKYFIKIEKHISDEVLKTNSGEVDLELKIEKLK